MYGHTSFALMNVSLELALALSERRPGGGYSMLVGGHFAYEEGKHVGMSLAEM